MSGLGAEREGVSRGKVGLPSQQFKGELSCCFLLSFLFSRCFAMMWNLQKCFLASRRTNTNQNLIKGIVIMHLDNMMSGMQDFPTAMS